MSLADYATIISGVVAVGASVSVVIGRALKHWIGEQLSELKPNGGGSTYDGVRRAALDAQRAANAAEEAHAHTEQLLERVSNLEQVVVAWAPAKKIAPSARGTKKATTTK